MPFQFQQPDYRRLAQAGLGLSLGFFLCSLPSLALAISIFSPPAGRGIPGRRETAGTRSDCLPLDKINPRSDDLSSKNLKKIEALVPYQTTELTVAASPTFFWYLPKNSLSEVELTLTVPGSRQPIYKALILTKGRSGVMSYGLPYPGGRSLLELNKTYRWTVRGICEGYGLPTQVEGLVKRIEPSPDLTQALLKANPAEHPKIYGSAGLWYDMLASLADLRQTQPRAAKLTTTWVQLMREIELEYMAREPLVQLRSKPHLEGTLPN